MSEEQVNDNYFVEYQISLTNPDEETQLFLNDSDSSRASTPDQVFGIQEHEINSQSSNNTLMVPIIDHTGNFSAEEEANFVDAETFHNTLLPDESTRRDDCRLDYMKQKVDELI
jgi:hypothetical protein